MDDIQLKIQTLQIQLESIQRAERYQQELERKRTAMLSRLDQLAKAMDKEHQELVDLEKWSLQELFVKMIDKQERLEKEKEDYLQAAMAYQEARKEVEMVEFEIGVLRDKISVQHIVETELRKLYDQRVSEILNDQEDHPLRTVLDQLARSNQMVRELEEAIIHGVNIQLILEAIAQHLIRAKNWIFNPMQDANYCNRMITEEVDEARLRLPKLRLEFVKFEKEMEEIFQYPELEDWKEDQWDELRQIQQLVRNLSNFPQNLLQRISQRLDISPQLHQIHTLADNLRHQTDTSMKWLRLEQDRIRQEIKTLQQVKQELLR